MGTSGEFAGATAKKNLLEISLANGDEFGDFVPLLAEGQTYGSVILRKHNDAPKNVDVVLDGKGECIIYRFVDLEGEKYGLLLEELAEKGLVPRIINTQPAIVVGLNHAAMSAILSAE